MHVHGPKHQKGFTLKAHNLAGFLHNARHMMQPCLLTSTKFRNIVQHRTTLMARRLSEDRGEQTNPERIHIYTVPGW